MIADDGHEILRRYGRTSVYPADVAYLAFRNALSRFRQHGCDASVVGRTLTRRLTGSQRKELLSHLPTAMARYLRQALALASQP